MKNYRLQKILILITTTLASFNSGFMGSAINIALPKISIEFNTSAISMSWIQTSFLLATAVTLLPFGKLSDIYGRAKFFKVGTFVFGVSSLLGALSQDIEMMIIFRSLQGVSASLISTTAITILMSAFPATERGRSRDPDRRGRSPSPR